MLTEFVTKLSQYILPNLVITEFVTEFGDKFGAKFVTKLLWALTSQGKLVGRKQSLKNLLHFNLQ